MLPLPSSDQRAVLKVAYIDSSQTKTCQPARPALAQSGQSGGGMMTPRRGRL